MNISCISSLKNICEFEIKTRSKKNKKSKFKENINSEINEYLNSIKNNYTNFEEDVLKTHKNKYSMRNITLSKLNSINISKEDITEVNNYTSINRKGKSMSILKLINKCSINSIIKEHINSYDTSKYNTINIKDINTLEVFVHFDDNKYKIQQNKNNTLKDLKLKLIDKIKTDIDFENYNFKIYDEDNNLSMSMPFLNDNMILSKINYTSFIFIKNNNLHNNYNCFNNILKNNDNILVKVNFQKFNIINSIWKFDKDIKIIEILNHFKKRNSNILTKDYHFKDTNNNIIPNHTQLKYIDGNEIFINEIKYKDLPQSSINNKISELDMIYCKQENKSKLSHRSFKKKENFEVNYILENNEKKLILSIDLKYIKLIDFIEKENNFCYWFNFLKLNKNKKIGNQKRKIKDIKHMNSVNNNEFILIFEGINEKEIIKMHFRSKHSTQILNRINQIKLNL